MELVLVLAAIALVTIVVLATAVKIVPQARAGVVERLGRYQRTLDAGLALVIPFVDRVKPLIDLREQVVSFDPQSVITEDNLVVYIDTVISHPERVRPDTRPVRGRARRTRRGRGLAGAAATHVRAALAER
nr:SPFH domain-containing protein [Actinomycetota bacterium]